MINLGDRTRLNANLIPFNKMDEKRKKEIQSMGGKKSQEINKKKKINKRVFRVSTSNRR